MRMFVKPAVAFRALTPVIISACCRKPNANQISRTLQAPLEPFNFRQRSFLCSISIEFEARTAWIRPPNLAKLHFRTLSAAMGPTKSKGRKAKADKPKTEEETTKPTRSTRGKSDKGESKSKSLPEKAKPETAKEEVMETSSPEGSEHESGSETSDKPISKKKGSQAKGKQKAQEKNVAEEHTISDDDSEAEEPSKPVVSPPKKRGRQAAAETSDEPSSEKSDEPSSKKSKTEDGTGDSKPKLNQTTSDYKKITLESEAETKDGKKWNFKISSWNVAGLKAWVKKDGLTFIKNEDPDIICLQETKCAEKDLPPGAKVSGYHSYWLTGEKKGYAGVALLSKEKPIKVDYGIGNKDFDCDGRIITAEFEKFFLVAVYVPNAGQKLKNLDRRMEWDPLLRGHIKRLDEKKPVILCGDMNVSHTEIDLANPKTNTKSAGFTQEERDGLTVLLKEGFVDTFRHLYPDKTGAYTFWTYMGNARSRNTGWRLDYFILSERFVPSVCDNVIRNAIYGSDHCPVTLFLHL